MEDAEGPGLRARKKAKTRDAIMAAAGALFLAKGYDATTIEEIAAAAEVAPRTFFRYFPTKEDLIFLNQDREDAALAHALAHRRPGEDDIGALIRAVLEALPIALSGAGHVAQFPALFKMIMTTPSLVVRAFEIGQNAERIIVAALTDRRSSKAELLRAQVLAGAFVGAFRVAITAWIETGMRGNPAELVHEVGRLLREGFAPAEAGKRRR